MLNEKDYIPLHPANERKEIEIAAFIKGTVKNNLSFSCNNKKVAYLCTPQTSGDLEIESNEI